MNLILILIGDKWLPGFSLDDSADFLFLFCILLGFNLNFVLSFINIK